MVGFKIEDLKTFDANCINMTKVDKKVGKKCKTIYYSKLEYTSNGEKKPLKFELDFQSDDIKSKFPLIYKGDKDQKNIDKGESFALMLDLNGNSEECLLIKKVFKSIDERIKVLSDTFINEAKKIAKNINSNFYPKYKHTEDSDFFGKLTIYYDLDTKIIDNKIIISSIEDNNLLKSIAEQRKEFNGGDKKRAALPESLKLAKQYKNILKKFDNLTIDNLDKNVKSGTVIKHLSFNIAQMRIVNSYCIYDIYLNKMFYVENKYKRPIDDCMGDIDSIPDDAEPIIKQNVKQPPLQFESSETFTTSTPQIKIGKGSTKKTIIKNKDIKNPSELNDNDDDNNEDDEEVEK